MSNDTPPKKPEGIVHPQPQGQSPAAQSPTIPYWILAFQESQRQMAQAHAAYQQSMAQAHTAFLNVLAQSQASMAAMAGQQNAAPFIPQPPMQQQPMPVQNPFANLQAFPPPTPAFAHPAPVFAHPAPSFPSPAPLSYTNGQTNGYTNGQTNGYTNGQSKAYSNGHTKGYAKGQASNGLSGEISPLVASPTPIASSASIESLLLTVIADKTGYPVETLSNEMHLESDLGIDSIKRVEILSAITEEAPGLEDVDPAQMSDISTIGGILAFLEGDTSASASSKAPKQNTLSFEDTLLEVVADKTGYPADMLNLDMKLETDLGIDSIKRVEILSAVSEKLPSVGDLDGSEMADLSTLGEIVNHVQDLGKK